MRRSLIVGTPFLLGMSLLMGSAVTAQAFAENIGKAPRSTSVQTVDHRVVYSPSSMFLQLDTEGRYETSGQTPFMLLLASGNATQRYHSLPPMEVAFPSTLVLSVEKKKSP